MQQPRGLGCIVEASVMALLALHSTWSIGQSYGAGNDAARRAAEQAAAERARAAQTQMDLERQRQQREQAESQRRQSVSPAPSTTDGRPQDRPASPAPSASPRELTEQERRNLERARANDRARADQEDRFAAYFKSCQATSRLDQPECWAASEKIRADAAATTLMKRMGRQWERYRLYREIPPEFQSEINRAESLANAADKARQDWDKGIPPDAQQVRSRLDSDRAAQLAAAQAPSAMRAAWEPVQNTETDAVYIDRSSVTRNADVATVRVLIDLKQPKYAGAVAFLSFVQTNEYKCSELKFRTRIGEGYGEKMATGRLIGTETYTRPWTDLGPTSNGANILRKVC